MEMKDPQSNPPSSSWNITILPTSSHKLGVIKEEHDFILGLFSVPVGCYKREESVMMIHLYNQSPKH